MKALSKEQYKLIKELYDMDEEADEENNPFAAYYDFPKEAYYEKHVRPLTEANLVRVVEEDADNVTIQAEYTNSLKLVRAYDAAKKAKKAKKAKAKPKAKAKGPSLRSQIRTLYDC